MDWHFELAVVTGATEGIWKARTESLSGRGAAVSEIDIRPTNP